MKKNDIILLLTCMLAGGGIFGGYRLMHRQAGDTVTVSIDGKGYQTLPLSREAEIDIPGAGGGTNHLVIRDGKASVTEADCPDGLCVHQGAISHDGESIVCLPHKVVIRISAGRQDDVDAVAQ